MLCKCGCEIEIYFQCSSDGKTKMLILHKDIKLNGRAHCKPHSCNNPRTADTVDVKPIEVRK